MTSPTPPPVLTPARRSLALALLVVAYTFNFIDRTIIATIGQAIKLDLKLTDTQLGLLGGIAFALLYTALGIPIARLAERWSRVNIIAVSILVWSGFTAACGAATSFAQLLLLRVGVGVGEAGLSPPAHSLISDYYEPKKRATALAIYSTGIPLGAMFGAVAGGWLTQAFSWRVAFVLVGLPGVLIALAVKLAIREPARSSPPPPLSVGGELREIGAVAKTLFGRWPMLNMTIGCTINSFASYGAGAFTPAYFYRAFGLDFAAIGLVTGIVAGISAGVGTLAGGFVTDRLAARHGLRWYALTPAIGLVIAAPLYFAAYLQPTWQTCALVLLLPGMFSYLCLAPTFGVLQNMVEARRRATATALLFFIINLFALGGGPVFTGWLADQFAQGGLAGFSTLCPGGVAALPENAAACQAALVRGTRDGILVTVCLFAWAGLHYFLGAIGLVRALTAAGEGAARRA